MKSKFPGFDKCMQMMRSRDPQTREDGFHWLQPHANEFVAELIAEYEYEKDTGLRTWLLELVNAAKSSDAFDFLASLLRSEDWKDRKWSIIGLTNLDTKEARTLLWQARSFELETKKETDRLRHQLDFPNAWW